jgi:thioredoxin 1
MTEWNKESFYEAIASQQLTVADFWAPWCGPCRMMAPIFEAAAEEAADVNFGKVNVDENGELARDYGIMSIPTIVFFKNGEEIGRSVGAIGKPALLAKIKELSE